MADTSTDSISNEILEASEQAFTTPPEKIPALKVLGVERRVHPIGSGCGLLPFLYNIMPITTDEGLVLVDTGLEIDAAANHERVRTFTDAPLHTAIFTHGHADHAYGVGPYDAEAAAAGSDRPRVVAQEAVVGRFDRYTETHGYNQHVNARQFVGVPMAFPTEHRYPDVTYRSSHEIEVGGRRIELHHARGETDDHTWVFLPEERILYPGDLFVWVVPNAGNPQKVQRFAMEWASALREMIAAGPELLVPSHGLPIIGRDQITEALDTTASLLESLHNQTVALMNEGATLNDILHSVKAPEELLARPWLGATYDEPEFIVRNVWRLYGGWHDGDPAHLKPPATTVLAREVADLAGGASALADRAQAAADAGDLRLAAQLAEWAGVAAPDDTAVAQVRGSVYAALVDSSTSLMAKGIYGAAAGDSGTDTGSFAASLVPDL